MQHKWISKLLGYNFVVEHKKRVENRAVDALSIVDQEEEENSILISFPIVDCLDELKAAYASDLKYKL